MMATDRLCHKLDERGIEYVSIGGITNWGHAEFDELADGSDTRLIVYGATPEEAIAATVGGGDVSALRAKVKAQSDYIGKLRGEYEALDEQMECRCAVYRATIRKLKAELDAATVGAGTCYDLAETPAYRDKTEFKCSECGYEYSSVGGFGCDHGEEPDFRFCPNCGRKVEVVSE